MPGVEKKSDPNFNIVESREESSPGGLPTALVKYTAKSAKGQTVYMERGFVASGDICGDFEFCSDNPLEADSCLKQTFGGYALDENHVPQFRDIFAYAEILYNHHQYAAAAPLFERA